MTPCFNLGYLLNTAHSAAVEQWPNSSKLRVPGKYRCVMSNNGPINIMRSAVVLRRDRTGSIDCVGAAQPAELGGLLSGAVRSGRPSPFCPRRRQYPVSSLVACRYTLTLGVSFWFFHRRAICQPTVIQR
ncbi:hypothetical protein LSAT2_016293 [Lamellibrachia satsuma]|nr:hypothetical protein LSAT2_016293 [Lamellibrachia satsuma]